MSNDRPTQCQLRISGCPVQIWQATRIRELERDIAVKARLLTRQAARIAKLEVERDCAVEELNHRVTHMKNMELRVNALEVERDAIEAATIEQCAAELE